MASSGRVSLTRRSRLVASGTPGHDVVTGVGEDALDACPPQSGVLGDHDPHGSTAVMIVGPVTGWTP